ncbi:hypothetical protein O3P69_013275 [Scylla paramamosain]|uniref:Uncharacterized protein n=1 Tax=Scylla paramamosain TaxID=85552 RepID=A0AAW0U102_SCYPA
MPPQNPIKSEAAQETMEVTVKVRVIRMMMMVIAESFPLPYWILICIMCSLLAAWPFITTGMMARRFVVTERAVRDERAHTSTPDDLEANTEPPTLSRLRGAGGGGQSGRRSEPVITHRWKLASNGGSAVTSPPSRPLQAIQRNSMQ